MSVSVDQARELAKNWRARHCETVAAALESLADQLDDIRSIGGGLTIEGMQESVDRAEAVQNQDEIIAALRAQLEDLKRQGAAWDVRAMAEAHRADKAEAQLEERERVMREVAAYVEIPRATVGGVWACDVAKRLRAPLERP